jgi:hypothetical protein
MLRPERLAFAVVLACGALWALPASADDPAYAIFALIVGVNTSVDSGAPTLRYADDDAARYLELFRALGARTYVLTRLDDNTRRLHPQIAAEALLPVRAEFDRAIDAAAYDVDQARRRHIKTVLYFVYAGHGSARDGRGYITLEDARLDAPELDARVVDTVGADLTHFIIDACDSYFLAAGRGPGGQRHEAHGFLRATGLRARDSVGLLLSTSSARESHEWSAFQAGVFSHEVRSALYGAADADGDGLVSYREVAAFVARANEAVPNEAYRSNVYAKPPNDSPFLLDLRDRWKTRLHLAPSRESHYFLEDSRGVRVADFHNDPTRSMYIIRPSHVGRLYLRRMRDDAEIIVPSAPELSELAELSPSEPRVASRGAAGDQFESLFALPFGPQAVRAFHLSPEYVDTSADQDPRGLSWRTVLAIGSATAGVASAGVGAVTLASAHSLGSGLGPRASQTEADTVNRQIRSRNLAAGVELAAGGAAVVAGAVLTWWPTSSTAVAAGASTSGGWVSLHGRF